MANSNSGFSTHDPRNNPMTYKTLDAYLATKDSRPAPGRKNNTRAIRRDEKSIAIQLHATDILIFHSSGAITLNSGGWRTSTTKSRINEYLPSGYQVNQKAGEWYINGDVYADGMQVTPKGTLKGTLSKTKHDARQKERKACNRYAHDFTAALMAGQVPAPSGGDCWACCKIIGNTDGQHIRDHIEEKYYVPRLLVNACEEVPTSLYVKGMIGELWREGVDGISGFDTDILKRDIPAIIRKYCQHQLDIATN